jgi:hypothetical protein
MQVAANHPYIKKLFVGEIIILIVRLPVKVSGGAGN